jgi:hypothetical protein
VKRVEVLKALWDRLLAIVLAVVALVVLLVGWKLISDTPFPAEQLPYMISAGIGGLALLGVAATVWLSADLRDEWHKLDRIDQRLGRLEGGIDSNGPAGPLEEKPDVKAASRRRRVKVDAG